MKDTCTVCIEFGETLLLSSSTGRVGAGIDRNACVFVVSNEHVLCRTLVKEVTINKSGDNPKSVCNSTKNSMSVLFRFFCSKRIMYILMIYSKYELPCARFI